MYIQKLTSLYNFAQPLSPQKKRVKTTQETKNIQATSNPLYITFQARVDKGLIRFYETNADRMPKTVKDYIESLPDKTLKTPLQAQTNAFEKLVKLTNISDIKKTFPQEELFKELKNPNDSKATRGVLGVYRQNKELLRIYDKDILSSGENLTVWLVKKIFLEGKTLDEINKDFSNNVDSDFQILYKDKEGDSQPIHSSTLKALGIKMPEFEYQQSLRYTREGYADIIGEKITLSLKEFFDSMPIEERTARAKKSIEKFEKWWNSIPRNNQLEMIANQISAIEMLEKFNTSKIGQTKKNPSTKNIGSEIEKNKERNNIKVESTLSRDDLFKIWATNSLRIFEANLTEYDKKALQVKREQRLAQHWENLTPKERIEYINRLKAGAEPLRYAMIDAWNTNPDILVKLSYAMKLGHTKRPLDVIYGSTAFNESLSNTLMQFWSENPDYSERLGNSISESHEKIKTAIANGTFESIKKEILKSRAKREAELLIHINNYREILTKDLYDSYPEYIKTFIRLYEKNLGDAINMLPKNYMIDFYNTIENELPQDCVESWTKVFTKETLTETDLDNIQFICDRESFNTQIMNRAAEATLAEELYHCTQDPRVFEISQADSKKAIMQILQGEDKISIYSDKLNKYFDFKILNREYDSADLDKLYNQFKAPIDEIEIDAIIENYFTSKEKITPNDKENYSNYLELKDYIRTYRSSAKIIFATQSKYPVEARAMFLSKFIQNCPIDILNGNIKINLRNADSFIKENKIGTAANVLRKKYNFLPKESLEIYIYELTKALRNCTTKEINTVEKYFLPRKNIVNSVSHVFSLDRNFINFYEKLHILATEQALADVLYESTQNDKVYALKLEELIDDIESFILAKRFPSESRRIIAENIDGSFDLNLKKRLNIYQIDKYYKNYISEITEYLKECREEGTKPTKEELLYILNPNENAKDIDKYTLARLEPVRELE